MKSVLGRGAGGWMGGGGDGGREEYPTRLKIGIIANPLTMLTHVLGQNVRALLV